MRSKQDNRKPFVVLVNMHRPHTDAELGADVWYQIQTNANKDYALYDKKTEVKVGEGDVKEAVAILGGIKKCYAEMEDAPENWFGEDELKDRLQTALKERSEG